MILTKIITRKPIKRANRYVKVTTFIGVGQPAGKCLSDVGLEPKRRLHRIL